MTCDEQGSTRRHHRGIAEGGGLARQHIAQGFRVLGRVSALEVFEFRTGEAQLFRRDLERGDTAVLQFRDPRRARRHDLVEARPRRGRSSRRRSPGS